MLTIEKYPAKVQHELTKLADDLWVGEKSPAFYEWLDNEIHLLKAALLALGFEATACTSAIIDKPQINGPWITVEAKEARRMLSGTKRPDKWWADKNDPERNALIDTIREHNLKAKSELVDLLTQFYQERPESMFSVHLIVVRKDWLGEFWLECQGADTASLPEKIATYPDWAKASQIEMRAFAEFLCSKVQ